MNDMKASIRHISMKGGGYYSQVTIGAKDVIDGGTQMILDALGGMDIPDMETPVHHGRLWLCGWRHLHKHGRSGSPRSLPPSAIVTYPDGLYGFAT